VITTDHLVRQYKCGLLRVEIYENSEAAAAAAAAAAASSIRELSKTLETFGVIFASGASQLNILGALAKISNVPWDHVCGFHMDEYVGIDADHPASFRRYLRRNLVERVPIREFWEIDGTAAIPEHFCADYASRLKASTPQLCLLGIGENGHLAFNDPHVANFEDPLDLKIVELDPICRQQQVAEGWFDSVEDVPDAAMTLTIPSLIKVPKLIVSVPGSRKAAIVRRSLTEPISVHCPATILRTHPNATLYLDLDSSAELSSAL
jgi:glucosamine-6-phosphate deaminase